MESKEGVSKGKVEGRGSNCCAYLPCECIKIKPKFMAASTWGKVGKCVQSKRKIRGKAKAKAD